jgi:hypothetical protein
MHPKLCLHSTQYFLLLITKNYRKVLFIGMKLTRNFVKRKFTNIGVVAFSGGGSNPSGPLFMKALISEHGPFFNIFGKDISFVIE